MKVFITKASEDNWYQIKEFKTIEDLQDFIKECDNDVIVSKNVYYNYYKWKPWKGMTEIDASIIKDCPLNIIIYDDYIEG